MLCTPVLRHNRFCSHIYRASYWAFYHLSDRGGCHARDRVCLLWST